MVGKIKPWVENDFLGGRDVVVICHPSTFIRRETISVGLVSVDFPPG